MGRKVTFDLVRDIIAIGGSVAAGVGFVGRWILIPQLEKRIDLTVAPVRQALDGLTRALDRTAAEQQLLTTNIHALSVEVNLLRTEVKKVDDHTRDHAERIAGIEAVLSSGQPIIPRRRHDDE